MRLKITLESPLTAAALSLIDGSEAALREVYPPEDCFTFTAEELDAPTISFFVARREDGTPAGCVALCDYDSYGEIKRLFVPESGRGLGTARALMAAAEAKSRTLGHGNMRLETGEKLAAAVALYAALGYKVCGPFGDYPEHPASLFMEKPLTGSD